MTLKEFELLLYDLEQDEHSIMLSKGREYTISSDDKLANFKRVAARTGIDILAVWLTYFLKHIDSICNFVKTKRVFSDEPIRGRFMDARNYLALGYAIVKELESETQETKS